MLAGARHEQTWRSATGDRVALVKQRGLGDAPAVVDVTDDAVSRHAGFVEEDFAFNRKTLRGVAELAPRWKRCVRSVDRDLGEALGQVFVQKTFASGTKERALVMTKEIEAAMESEIQKLPWMGDDVSVCRW